MGKCHIEEGMSADDSDDQQMIQDTTLDACCTACDEWMGPKPCGGYTYNTTSHTCTIKSTLGLLTNDPENDLVVGYPAEVRECAFNCLMDSSCAAFKHNYTSGQCSTGRVHTLGGAPNELQQEAGIHFYEIEYNTQPSRPVDCVEMWTSWSSSIPLSEMWDYCGLSPSSQLQCTDACTENSTRQSVDPPVYGGAACSPTNTRQRPTSVCTNETAGLMHILLVGGNSDGTYVDTILDFMPETKQFIMLKQRLAENRVQSTAVLYQDRIIIDGGYNEKIILVTTEFLASVPLNPQSIGSVPSYPRYGGCSFIWNDKLHHCFGSSVDIGVEMSHCDVYDLTNNNAHSTLSTQVPAMKVPACVQSDQYLYVLGGSAQATGYLNQFYKMNLADGTKTDLSLFHFAAKGVSAVWFGGNIVACGGVGTPGRVSTCKEYTIGSGWTDFASMTVPRSEFPLVNFGANKLLAIGGWEVDGSIDAIDMYDRAKGNWTRYASLPHTLSLMASVVLNAL